ncbi:MAG: molybdate ABC transporter substrate-binding protein [Motiliproteus sp.]
MPKSIRLLIKTLVSLLLLISIEARGDQILVAAASNFSDAIKAVVKDFEQQSEHRVTLILGSTGKHYAQIINGAPFDAFFAADSKRPALLEQQKIALDGSRFTYAQGKVVLWSPKQHANIVDAQILNTGEFRHLAIANPKLAPYGKAAQQFLQARQLWQPLIRKMVRGENIAQTYQFVKSGNAELGFVAYSQVKRPGHSLEGSMWEVPQSLYTPIKQQAVVLTDKPSVKQFIDFIRSPTATAIINAHGYTTP